MRITKALENKLVPVLDDVLVGGVWWAGLSTVEQIRVVAAFAKLLKCEIEQTGQDRRLDCGDQMLFYSHDLCEQKKAANKPKKNKSSNYDMASDKAPNVQK